MSIETLYCLAALIPMLILPVMLPSVVLMAVRKRMTDAPNERKLQEQPVVVMGGTVVIVVMCIALVIINLFYPITEFFAGLCVMVILYVIGLLDDTIGMPWYIKLVVQTGAILLLFFGGDNAVHSLFGLFVDGPLPEWLSCLLTVLIGLILLNAVNFIDGIDGLASSLAVLSGLVMAFWSIRHGFVSYALLSFIFSGSLLSFFFFNVFSNKYKMYLGDSGSMLIGLFVFITVCPAPLNTITFDFLADRYFVSFTLALFSAMIFDMVRVIISRIIRGKSPFLPDRLHLHHIYVDHGMSHLVATLVILSSNGLTILLWYLTAASGINIELQFFAVILSGIIVYWLPYYFINRGKIKNPQSYDRHTEMWERVSQFLVPMSDYISGVLDNLKFFRLPHSNRKP